MGASILLANSRRAKISFIGFLVVFKCVADLFWSYAILDYATLVCAIALFLMSLRSLKEIRLTVGDACVFTLLFILTVQLIRDPAGVYEYIKMASCSLLYFVGRASFSNFYEALEALKCGVAIAVLVNGLILLMGGGFKIWGGADTFSGVYFFKTDLACAMCLAISTFLFFGKDRKIAYPLICIAAVLLFLSNTRAYYIIAVVVFLLFGLWRRGARLGGRTVLYGVLTALCLLLALNALSYSDFFRDMGFISFRFESIADLFNETNTQGRSVIWDILFRRMRDAGPISQLFGHSFTGDEVFVNGGQYDSHSLYVGMLFNTGVVGLSVLIAFLLYIVWVSTKLPSARMRYFMWALMAQFVISGLSVHVLQYTNTSWMPLLFSGAAITVMQQRAVAGEGED